MSDIRTSGLHISAEISRYIKAKFRNCLEDKAVDVTFPLDWKLSLLQECDQLVTILVSAFRNQKRVEWSVIDYVDYLQTHSPRASGQNTEFEKNMTALFPPLNEEISYEVEPFVVTDRDGYILIWYLPGALKPHRQKSFWNTLSDLEPSFVRNEYSSSWRNNSFYYMDPKLCRTHLPGTVSLAPAWFQQGHEKTHPLEVSAALRKDYGLTWIKKNRLSFAIISSALSIMHPEYYAAGIKAFERISENPDIVSKNNNLLEILKSWGTPFSSLSIISNRRLTPLHRDNGAGYPSIDLLSTIGTYIDGYMSFPSIGIRVWYCAGTLVGILGKVIPHKATSNGERACVAYYMRENVVRALNGTVPGFVNVSDVLAI